MLNKAPVACIRCGETVEVGDGHFVKVAGKGWKVEHATCPVVQRARDSLDVMAHAYIQALQIAMRKSDPE